jgi:hypothetical protein
VHIIQAMPSDKSDLTLAYAEIDLRRSRNRRIAFAIALAIALLLMASPTVRWTRHLWLEFRNWRAISSAERELTLHPIFQNTLVFSSSNANPPPMRGAMAALENAAIFELSPRNPWPTFSIYAGRRRAGATSRFITIDGNVRWRQGSEAYVDIEATVFGDHFGDHAVWYAIGGGGWGNGARAPLTQPEVEIYSAVEDPNDPSHLTIRCFVLYDCVSIDCWLQPDGTITSSQNISGRSGRK